MSRLPGGVQSRMYAPQQVIFQEGDEAHGEAFLIHSGKVEIRKRLGGVERSIRVLGEGELLGELALFRNAPRSATAAAVESAVLIVIAGDRLNHLVRTNPDLSVAIVRQLAERLWEAEQRAS